MILEKVIKLNVKDGDIIILPEESTPISYVEGLIKTIESEFGIKRFLVILLPIASIKNMKVLSIPKEK